MIVDVQESRSTEQEMEQPSCVFGVTESALFKQTLASWQVRPNFNNATRLILE